MANLIGQFQPESGFQALANLHNRAILILSEHNILITPLRIDDIGENANSMTVITSKIIALVLLGLPAVLWHALACAYDTIINCFTVKSVELNDQDEPITAIRAFTPAVPNFEEIREAQAELATGFLGFPPFEQGFGHEKTMIYVSRKKGG